LELGLGRAKDVALGALWVERLGEERVKQLVRASVLMLVRWKEPMLGLLSALELESKKEQRWATSMAT